MVKEVRRAKLPMEQGALIQTPLGLSRNCTGVESEGPHKKTFKGSLRNTNPLRGSPSLVKGARLRTLSPSEFVSSNPSLFFKKKRSGSTPKENLFTGAEQISPPASFFIL